jgi:hypothetical protein
MAVVSNDNDDKDNKTTHFEDTYNKTMEREIVSYFVSNNSNKKKIILDDEFSEIEH